MRTVLIIKVEKLSLIVLSVEQKAAYDCNTYHSIHILFAEQKLEYSK